MGTPTTPRHHDSWSELVEVAGYADGVPRNIDIPQQTVDEMFEETASRFGSRLALDFFGATTSYRELQTQINAAATTLQPSCWTMRRVSTKRPSHATRVAT